MLTTSHDQFRLMPEQSRLSRLRRLNIAVIQLARNCITHTELAIGESASYWLKTYGGGISTNVAIDSQTPLDTSRRLHWLHLNPNSDVVSVHEQMQQFTFGEWVDQSEPETIARLRGVQNAFYPGLPTRPTTRQQLEMASHVLGAVQGITVSTDRLLEDVRYTEDQQSYNYL